MQMMRVRIKEFFDSLYEEWFKSKRFNFKSLILNHTIYEVIKK